MRLVCSIALAFLFSACAWMGDDGVTFFRGEKAISQEATKDRLREAIFLNIAKCSSNTNSGLYAQDYIVPGEVTHSYYYEESVNNCYVAILLVSCNINPDQNILLVANLYRTVIRLCHLRPATG